MTPEKTAETGLVYCQVRLTPALAQALRDAGEPHGRRLPAEIVHRLQASLEPEAPAARVGHLVERLADRVSAVTGERDQGALAALTGAALPELLKRLMPVQGGVGCPQPDKQARALALAVARTLGNEGKGTA